MHDIVPGERTSILDRLWSNIGFIVAAGVLVYCVVHAFDPPRLNWGDSESDYNVMNAGRNFATYGFIKLRLTPHLMDYKYLTMPYDRSLIYTHYPQLPDLINGVERVLGLSSLTQFRFVALCFTFGSLFFFYRLVERCWDRATAQLALLLWVVNPLFLQHADYLHHLPYMFFFGFGTLFFLDRYLRGAGAASLALAGGAIYFTFASSYDYWFFVPIIVALMTVRAYGRDWRPALRVLAILGGCAALAILCKFATNAWVLGGVEQWFTDFRFQFAERGTADVTGIDPRIAAWPTFKGHVARYYSDLLYLVALFWLAAPWLRKRFAGRWPSIERATPNPLWLLVAAVPFLLMFSEMWIGQAYPFLLLLPFAAVGSAALGRALLDAPMRPLRLASLAFIVGLAANDLTQDATFPTAVMSNETVASLQRDLDRVSAPDQPVASNTSFDALYRYYFRRNMAAMIYNMPERMPVSIFFYSHSPRFKGSAGFVYVEHKHVERQLYDKGLYYLLARLGMWEAWGNPPRFRREIDQLVLMRNGILSGLASRFGRKVAETDAYIVWLIPPLGIPQPG